jgi:hypothetical protein
MITWKITDTTSENGVIHSAKYYVSATDGDYTVEAEGYWYFDSPTEKVPFAEVTEQMVAQWIETEAVTDGKCHITERLLEQLEAIKKPKSAPSPWMPQVFIPGQ